MDPQQVANQAQRLADQATGLARDAQSVADNVSAIALEAATSASASGLDPIVVGFTVFVLACFVGYHVVWGVTSALHSPLMGITNAISSVIIVGALIAAGPIDMDGAKIMGFLAVTLASVNIFGGFLVTRRMLSMFKKKS